MKDKFYSLKINQQQAQTLRLACEVLARLGMGQFHQALENMPIDWKKAYSQDWNDDLMAIGKILSKHTVSNVDGWGKSLGINNASETSKIAWDLYQVIRHRISWDRAIEEGIVENENSPRDWSKMMMVSYDEPFKCSEDSLALIEKLNEN